ncbi:MAG TPA: class I SAM-dependent methyltransferase [Arcobacter sp.]|nr:class I SAM-dependent methyltransferase [Arcobacter sp.]
MNNQYANKEASYEEYFNNIRVELLNLIPNNLRDGKLLEIGAGTGNTLIHAKENGFATEVHGIELCKITNSNQENPLLDNFIIGNVESLTFPYEKKSFDVIICGDVLEHLLDPYTMVEKPREYLTDDGIIILSLPNIREINVLKQIVFQGDFKYVEAGILDKTHLRFFAKKT